MTAPWCMCGSSWSLGTLPDQTGPADSPERGGQADDASVLAGVKGPAFAECFLEL